MKAIKIMGPRLQPLRKAKCSWRNQKSHAAIENHVAKLSGKRVGCGSPAAHLIVKEGCTISPP